MKFHFNFPKDKEEMQRKRMEAMLKKIGGGKPNGAGAGGGSMMDGEKRLEEINVQLTKYYRENKDINFKKSMLSKSVMGDFNQNDSTMSQVSTMEGIPFN